MSDNIISGTVVLGPSVAKNSYDSVPVNKLGSMDCLGESALRIFLPQRIAKVLPPSWRGDCRPISKDDENNPALECRVL